MNTKHVAGFSLIEMMVVIGIMGVMAAAGIASYNRLNDRIKVEQAATALATELRVMQKRADAGVNQCGEGISFSGVRVSYLSGNQIDFCDLCGADCQLISTYSLINGTNIQNFSPFIFKGMGRGVNEVRQLSISNSMSSYYVRVSLAGGIDVTQHHDLE